LIDLMDPDRSYSTGRWRADAIAAVREILAKGKTPLIVGGTMLYYRALVGGLDALPQADPQVRAAIDAEAASRGWPALHAELERVDPKTARRIGAGDTQRIQRALEVWQLTGRPLSQAHGQRVQAGLPLPLVALEPRARSWLHERIAVRFHAMLHAGLVDEVRALRARTDVHASLPSMRCVGYRQVWQALDEGDLSAVAERGIAATRQLAKRQLTWLRRMPGTRGIQSGRIQATAHTASTYRPARRKPGMKAAAYSFGSDCSPHWTGSALRVPS